MTQTVLLQLFYHMCVFTISYVDDMCLVGDRLQLAVIQKKNTINVSVYQ